MDAATYAEIRRLALAGGAWNCQPFGRRSVADGRRVFGGWVVPPGAIPLRYQILANGRPLKLEKSPGATAGNVEHVFARCGLESQREKLSFQFELPAELDQDVEIDIVFTSLPGQGRMLPFRVPAQRPAVEPSRLVMQRTTHIADPYLFYYNGCTDFHRLKKLFEAASPTCSRQPRILDWGCGCGRVSWFMERSYGAENVFGVDIDAVGIQWLLGHGGQGRFQLIGRDFSLPFESASFDLIYGISVMTHLRSDDQRCWLAELVRVLRPGGVAILTFHSLVMFFTHVNDGAALQSLLREGFWDYGRCTDLDEGSPEAAAADSYRNVFNTHEHILKLCPESCEVVALVPGGSSAQHDYVVFQKRPDAG